MAVTVVIRAVEVVVVDVVGAEASKVIVGTAEMEMLENRQTVALDIMEAMIMNPEIRNPQPKRAVCLRDGKIKITEQEAMDVSNFDPKNSESLVIY